MDKQPPSMSSVRKMQKQIVQLEEYFAVDYVAKFYIGLVVGEDG